LASDLYEQDLPLWSEQQADLLERLAAGERVNEQIDWPNVIEELRDLGASEVRSCRSWLLLTFVHLLKLKAWPDARSVAPWTTEILNFSTQFREHYVASMRGKIDVDALYEKAWDQVRGLNWPSPGSIPDSCPYTLDDLVSPRTTVSTLLAKLDPPA
jgi:hypothetical protein